MAETEGFPVTSKTRFTAMAATAVAFAAGLSIVTMQSPASAHDTEKVYAYTPSWANAGYARVYQSHQKIQVCDTNSNDGEGVYAAWYDTNGGYHTTSDTNGASTGCGYGTAPSGTTIYRFQMRSREAGSHPSEWRYA